MPSNTKTTCNGAEKLLTRQILLPFSSTWSNFTSRFPSGVISLQKAMHMCVIVSILGKESVCSKHAIGSCHLQFGHVVKDHVCNAQTVKLTVSNEK